MLNHKIWPRYDKPSTENNQQKNSEVSYDVINLYSSILHKLRLEAIKFWLYNHPQRSPTRIQKDFIIRRLKFLLENSYFIFNKKPYRQLSGSAMCTRIAPTFANLVMGYLEKFYQKIQEKYGNSSEYIKTRLRQAGRDTSTIASSSGLRTKKN